MGENDPTAVSVASANQQTQRIGARQRPLRLLMETTGLPPAGPPLTSGLFVRGVELSSCRSRKGTVAGDASGHGRGSLLAPGLP